MSAANTQTAPTAQETAQRGREQLATVQTRLEQLHDQQRALEARQRANTAAVNDAQQRLTAVQAAQETLEQEIARAMVAQLLTATPAPPDGGEGDAEDAELAAFDRRRAELAKAFAEAQHAVAVAQKTQEADVRRAEREAAATRKEIATQERLAAALREAIATAHQAAGLDAVAEIQGEQDTLVDRRRRALEEYTAASGALFALYTDCAERLAAWPELARQGADTLTNRLTAGRDVGEMFLAFCDALQRQAGQDAFPALGNGTQAVSLLMTMGKVDEQLIRSLLASGGVGWRQRLSQIRQEAERTLERYDVWEPTQVQMRAHQRAEAERQSRERAAELEREIAREERLAELQRRERAEREASATPSPSDLAARRRLAQTGFRFDQEG